jgi:hypothetical protein
LPDPNFIKELLDVREKGDPKWVGIVSIQFS